MNDPQLLAELQRVSRRYRRFMRRIAWTWVWTVAVLAVLATCYFLRGQHAPWAWKSAAVLGVLGIGAIPWYIAWRRQVSDPLWLAHKIERKYPDLDARLLAALEQKPLDESGRLGFLQQSVVDQVVVHAARQPWEAVLPRVRLRAAALACWGMFLALLATLPALARELRRPALPTPVAPEKESFTIRVEPEDTSVEKGTALLVLARFGMAHLPGEVQLLARDADGRITPLAMSKSLDDPLFAARVPAVKQPMTYAVRYGDQQTRWYTVGVFENPELRQADATLRYPQYTGLDEKTVRDTRSVTAVEGTKATLEFHLNKPVASATLVPAKRAPQAPATRGARGAPVAASAPAEPAVPLTLTPKPGDPSTYIASLEMKQSQTYQLQLVDADKRANRDQASMTLNVTVNRPPDLKVQSPARDLDVSPLEEITVRAQVWDDYGVKRVGLTYAIAGEPPVDVTLAENIPARERRDVSQIISLEKLKAEPDQLLSYHLWTEDMGPDGKLRRSSGDMFFADVRPFEEIYRQGQALAAGQEEQQQRQQQQQQQGQQGQNAQNAEQAAATLKQVIAATWNLMRRETGETPSPQFVPDVSAVETSQATVRERTQGMAENLTDERSLAFLQSGLKNMDQALEHLKAAETAPAVKPLPDALSAEQAAYQDLLKLRAREFEVTRSNNRQQGQQSASAQRQQRQVNQMNSDQQQNPYQARRNAAQQQPQTPDQAQQETDAQRETRQVLSRLRDLAQRQEDLNRQMRDMQSALQQAQTPQQRDDLQRQLATLRDQQQQQLRDADELMNRMDEPQNQEQMADSREQLGQTRNNLQQASQNLNSGNMQQASAAGQRASEQLGSLQNQVRRAAAGQFGEAMSQMRDQARQLEVGQQEIDQRLAQANQPAQTAPAGLRDTVAQSAQQQRQQIAQDLARQEQDLQKLMDTMRQTVEDAETPEPMLSRQLYDSIRQAQQQQPDRALDTSRQLVQQGLLQEARQSSGDATQGITRLREGIDQAAAGVLGDETQALRRARDQLDQLAQQLDRERGRAGTGAQTGADTQTATRPGAAQGDRQLASAATRPVAPGDPAASQPAQPGARGTQQPGDQQARGTQNPDGQARAGTPGQQGNQPRGAAGDQQGAAPDDQQAANAQNGDPTAGEQQPGGTRGEPQLAQAGRGAGLRGDPQNAQPGARGGQARGAQPGDPAAQDQPSAQDPQGGARGGNRGGARGGQQAGGGNDQLAGGENRGGPITGDGFRTFTDSLRDVEEMVNDPQLRAQAANIRQNATNLRSDYLRRSQPPSWNIVQDTLSRPLSELRSKVAQELLRRESAQAMVPLDKEPVPPAYQEQVRSYYERLGSGK